MSKTCLSLLLLLLSFTEASFAAPSDDIYTPSKAWAIDSTQNQELRFTLNSTLFFRDNEISTPLMRGYTLPGFRLAPAFSYQPDSKVRVDVGLYMLRFWGADSYPNLAYTDIASWTGDENASKGLHLLPLLRVNIAACKGLNFVLGSIYGGYHHHLLEPLYAPELSLIADPESGAQILFANSWLEADTWVNWESFIYRGDTHQEAFTFGVSSKFKYNKDSSDFHVYSPLQLVFQHRGGEIDTLYTNSVQTLFNGAVGIGAQYNTSHRLIKSVALEADALVYNQQVGEIWPFEHGWAYFLHSHARIGEVQAKVGYFYSHKFISIFGYPFFGGVSTSNDGLTFDTGGTWLAGVDYSHEFSPGFVLGANAVIFRHTPGMGLRDGKEEHHGASTSFCGSLFMRINPSFIIKKFSK